MKPCPNLQAKGAHFKFPKLKYHFVQNLLKERDLMKIRLLTTFIATLFLFGCAFGYPGLRDSNREKMSLLRIGMPISQVEQIMGTKGFGEINQPYRKENFESNGAIFDVYYYYTEFIVAYQPMETGMTPVIFKNGKYIGSGKDFLSKVR